MPSRLAYRQAAARTLGALYTGTATSGSSTTVLECTSWPFKSTIEQDDRFEHYLLYRPTAAAADQLRSVTTNGYSPIVGQFTVDQVYASAPTVGESFEMMNLLDPDTIHRLVNDALKMTPVTVEVTFTPASTTARRHSLANVASWLTDPDAVYQVGMLTSSEARSDVDPFSRSKRGYATERGGVVYLEGPAFNTTDTVYVLASRPAYTYCRASAGVYGDLTTGLATDTDEAPVEVDWVAAGVKMLAWDAFRDLWWPGENQVAEAKVAQAAARFWALTRDNWTQPERRFTPLVAWGVAPYARTPIG